MNQQVRSTDSRWTALAGHPAFQLALLCCLPLGLLMFNRGWIYNQPGMIDTWVYIGFFENYDLPQYFIGEKKILRLPWIWTGFAAYRIFPPLVANYLLHLFSLLAAPIALYLVIRKSFANWIAFLVAVSLLLYVPFHAPGGWDYHDGEAAFFYILTFWFLSNAATERNALRWMALAGAAWSAALHANIIFINWTPLLVIHFLVVGGLPRFDRIWRLLVAGLAGFVAITVVFGIGNYFAGRSFLFPWIFLQRVFVLVSHPDQQVWWLPWSSSWFLGSEGMPLALLAALLVPACWLLVTRWRQLRRPHSKADAVALALQAEFVLAAAILVVWQMLGQTSLQPWYMAEPILYPAMFAIAGQLHLASASRDYRRGIVLIVVPATYLIALAGCRALGLDALFDRIVGPVGVANVAIIVFALYLAAFGSLWFSKGHWAGLAAFALLFVVADVVHVLRAPAYLTVPGVSHARLDAYAYPEACELREDLYQATLEANRYLTALHRNPSTVAIWWDDSEVLGQGDNPNCKLPSRYVAIPIAATGFTRVIDPDKATREDVLAPRAIVVVSADPARTSSTIDRINRASRAAASMDWSVRERKQIDTPTLKFALTLLEPDGINVDTKARLVGVFPNYDATKPLRIETPPQPWAYGAVLASGRPDLKGPVWIRLRAKVSGGPVGIGVLNLAGDDFSIRQRVDADASTQEITLILPDGVPTGDLVFESWEEGTPGIVILENLEILAPKSTAH